MMPVASREAELLLHCARTRLPLASRERIRALCAQPLEWEDFLSLAAHHGLMPLCYERLNEIAPQGPPKAAMVKLWAARQRTLAQNNEMADELFGILGDLDAVGIHALPYKGPTLALDLYGDVGLRQFGDLDILLHRDHVPHAQERLRARGYVAQFPLAPAVERAFLRSGAQYHLAMRHEQRGMMVELHWRVDPDIAIEPEAPGAKRFRSRELLLVLMIHGSKHRWSSLGWLVDVAELMARDPVDWKWIEAKAATLRCRRRLALGVLLAQALLDAPAPGEVVARMRDVEGMESLCTALAAELLEISPAEPSPRAMLRENLGLLDTRAQRLKHLLDTVWSPSLVEWTRWPLPRVLFFLYPPLRLLRLTGKHGAATMRPKIPAAATPRTPPPPPRSTD